MQRANEILLGIALAVLFVDGVGAQQSTAAKPLAQRTEPLVLTETIPLEGIKGRFDHFGFGGGRIFVATSLGKLVALALREMREAVRPGRMRRPSRKPAQNFV